MSLSALTPGAAVPERQDARKHYSKATAAFGLGKYDEAAIEYEAAFQIKPDPALLYNAAQAYRLAGKTSRAAQLYRNYLRLYGDAQNSDDARQHLASLESTAVAPPAAPASRPPQSAPGLASSSRLPATSSLPTTVRTPASPPSSASSPSPAFAPRSQDLQVREPPPGTKRVADLAIQSSATATMPATPPTSNRMVRPILWAAAGAVVLAAGTVWMLSRSRPQDPTPSLGTIVGN